MVEAHYLVEKRKTHGKNVISLVTNRTIYFSKIFFGISVVCLCIRQPVIYIYIYSSDLGSHTSQGRCIYMVGIIAQRMEMPRAVFVTSRRTWDGS